MRKDWKLKEISEICLVTDYVANGSFKSLSENVKYNYEKDYAILLRTTDFTKKFKKEFVYVSESAFNFLSKSTVFPDDIIICNVGSVGITFLVPDLGQPMTIGPNSILVRPLDSQVLDNKFFYFLVQSPIGQDLIKTITSGTTQSKFNKTNFRQLQILLPPLPEQKRIVAKLDQAFTAIAKAKANAELNLNNAKELFESYLQGMFESEKDGYEKTTLGNIVIEMMTGPFGSMLHKSDYVEQGIPVINPQNIVEGRIEPLQKTMINEVTFSKLKKYALIENDIIMARRGEMGRCAIVKKENINWLCGTGSLVIRGNMKKVNTDFLNRYLSSANIKEQLERASIGATMNNLNQKVLSNLKLQLPSLKEQEFVIQNIERLSNETKKLETIYQNKIEDLEELKRSILQKAFNGDI